MKSVAILRVNHQPYLVWLQHPWSEVWSSNYFAIFTLCHSKYVVFNDHVTKQLGWNCFPMQTQLLNPGRFSTKIFRNWKLKGRLLICGCTWGQQINTFSPPRTYNAIRTPRKYVFLQRFLPRVTQMTKLTASSSMSQWNKSNKPSTRQLPA